MIISFSDLCEKQVINCNDGAILGNICDLEINTEENRIISITVCGFSIFTRHHEFRIRTECIEKIGKDTIIVNINTPPQFNKLKDKKGGKRFKLR